MLAHFESISDLKSMHMLALIDLQKTFKVEDSRQLRKLENLHHAVSSRTNALKALGVSLKSYDSLAILGIRESLPYDLQVRYSLSRDDEADLTGVSPFLPRSQPKKRYFSVRRKSRRPRPP